jgi:diguanylate cyclase (GGDEF)-like protein
MVKIHAAGPEQQEDHYGFASIQHRLGNRRLLQEAIVCLQRTKRGSLALLDVDNFRVVNDTVGHVAGDQLLADMAQVLQSLLGPESLVTRLSGDEFAVFLGSSRPGEAQAAAERLRLAISEHRFGIEGHVVSITVSIGIAPIDSALTPQDTLVLAYGALRHAKEQGRNSTTLYGSHQLAQIVMFSAWVTRINDALQQDDRFVLHFQPIVRLDTAEVVHWEALIRWRGDDGNIALPNEFLPVAEHCGLMPQIDRWVIRQVAELLRKEPTISACINISAQGLKDGSLLEFAENHLPEMGVKYTRVVFEITEASAVANLGEVQQWMHRLRKLGCRFALDDFGTGFSSLSYLRALPADYIKIAGTFIHNIDVDATNQALVSAIRAMAQALGKQVIAEWVETAAVAAALRAIGVELGQGHYWGKPMELVQQPPSEKICP